MPFRRWLSLSMPPAAAPVNSSMAPGREPVPSTRSMPVQFSSGAYFFTSALISSSLVPGAMLPIHSFIDRPPRSSHDVHAPVDVERLSRQATRVRRGEIRAGKADVHDVDQLAD